MKKLFNILFYIFGGLTLNIFFCADVIAAPKDISLVVLHVNGDRTLSKEKARDLVLNSVQIINSQIPQIRITPTIVYKVRDRFKRYLKTNNENKLWVKWRFYMAKAYPHFKLRNALIQPIPYTEEDVNKWYFVGISSASCPYGSFPTSDGGSISTASEFRWTGEGSIPVSTHILSHEILHQLSATHDDKNPENVMHSGIGLTWEQASVALKVSRQTKKEVLKCINGKSDFGF